MQQEDTFKISVIVTTYNWPGALRLVLGALAEQSDQNFEIIVADDGSTPDTQALIESLQQTMPHLRHVWQADEGFRVAQCRNKAVLQAEGEYLIFLDGDCIPLPHFVARHRRLAQSDWFVAGNRLLLGQHFTVNVLKYEWPIHRWSFSRWWRQWLLRRCNRILPLLTWPFAWGRSLQARAWKTTRGCNMALWKRDLIRVNGWDEQFSGWGYEDSDLVLRLLNAGLSHKSGRCYVPVLHLWHPQCDRRRAADNLLRLQAVQKTGTIRALYGLEQYGDAIG